MTELRQSVEFATRNDLMNKVLEAGRQRKLEMAFRPGIGAGKPADWAKRIRRNVAGAALAPWISKKSCHSQHWWNGGMRPAFELRQ